MYMCVRQSCSNADVLLEGRCPTCKYSAGRLYITDNWVKLEPPEEGFFRARVYKQAVWPDQSFPYETLPFVRSDWGEAAA